ncbi:MAG TPA: DUF3619 family protein [Zeimonas sp.]
MNERELARIVRGALDESAARLPPRHVRRLAAARAAALAHARTARRFPRTAHDPVRNGHPRETGSADASPPRLLWRLAAVVVPIVLVAAGLVGISALDTQLRADDLADLDAAMLADEVPIAAYADRGFGVYLRNVAWQTEAAEE